MRKPDRSIMRPRVGGLIVVSLITCCATLLNACDSAGSDGTPPVKGHVVVPSRADIFAAGAAEVPAAKGGGGLVPEVISLQGASYVAFTEVTDSVTPNPVLYDFMGAEGSDSGETVMSGYGGIAGLVHHERFMFLAGVFLTDSVPTPPAPDSLDVTGMGTLDEVKSVGIGQVFFVGDGRSTGGKVQRFFVPKGATRIFLGFADHDRGVLQPGFYDDNKGSLGVRYELHKDK